MSYTYCDEFNSETKKCSKLYLPKCRFCSGGFYFFEEPEESDNARDERQEQEDENGEYDPT